MWSGREVLIWGGAQVPDPGQGPYDSANDGVAYNPTTKTWRAIPAAPIGGRVSHQAVWTGDRMIVWGGMIRCCAIDSVVHDPAAASYDPATNAWTRLADVPPPWSGDDGTAVTLATSGRTYVWRRGQLGTYDPGANTWVALPAPPAVAGDDKARSTLDPSATATVLNGHILVWAGNYSKPLHGFDFDPATSTWRTIADLQTGTNVYTIAVTAGNGVVYANSEPLRKYVPASDRWQDLPPSGLSNRSGSTVAWTGSMLMVWAGFSDTGMLSDGAILDGS